MLGRYQIIKHLANGGMAQVLLARTSGIEGFERHVVVKRIHSDRSEDPEFVKMFLDEARLAAQLHHNNIVHVHDIGKEQGEYFFAMEYVHGEDLRKLLMRMSKRKEQVPLEHIVTIITTVALALHHAHEQRGADRKPLGLVHRDVSPANIIVGYDGNVKVVDFGIAKAALRVRPDDTKGGALKGKVSYMAPEQCSGQPVDRRSDVYALGIVLFELCTVRRLFKGTNDFLTMSAIVQGHVPQPSSYRPDLPPELEAIILKALALEPADRYQNADDMREALEQFAATNSLRMSTGSLANYMKQVFGHRVEPWHDEEPLELEMTVDFDGSVSGAAKLESNEHAVPGLLEPRPSSPILRARIRAGTDADQPTVIERRPDDLADAAATPVELIVPVEPVVPLVPREPMLPAKLLDKPPKDDGWTNGSPTTGSALAWPTDVTGTTASAPRKKLIAITSVLAIVAGGVVWLAMRSTGNDRAANPPPAPAKQVMPVVIEPPPPPPAPPPTAGSDTAAITPPKNLAAGSAVAAAGSAAPRKPIKKPIKKPKEQWNPDELFLPEKK